MSPSRRLLTICTLGAAAGVVVFFLNPVNSTVMRLAFLGSLLGAWAGLTYFVWNRKALRFLVMLAPSLLTIPFLLPGRPFDSKDLRADYMTSLASYEATRYFWGGESPRGIDCSGLPRRALRDALLKYGFRHANGLAFRTWLEHWWFDASAKALSEGYSGYTHPTGTSGTIRKMDYASVEPGDLALTRDGIHALVYAGDGKWIQADPGLGAVATLDGRTDENPWFRLPVTLHRWQLLTP